MSNRGGLDLKEEEKAAQVIPPVTHNISAQTFTFRELAAATHNFRPECFIGEGGFGPVYRGRIESTGQVRFCLHILVGFFYLFTQGFILFVIGLGIL
jgi:hypothetical protein